MAYFDDYSIKSKVVRFRVSKFVDENVFNNSHIDCNNECNNINNKNDNKILK